MARSASQGSAADRSIRSLMQLEASASTSRTLNLIAVWKRSSDAEDYRAHPFFASPVLNRSIIVKHRLRHNERDSMPDGQTTATKVILPIDPTDLRLGARSFFVRQFGYDEFMDEISVDRACRERDAYLLGILDQLPSLDPFLMRERLSKQGYAPARCYFDLTDADTTRMFNFVRTELAPLIGMSFDDMDARLNDKTSKLATKILANKGDAELEPLRRGMGIPKETFEEGMFCWKGFIYYKWTLSSLLPQVRPVVAEIGMVRPSGLINADEIAYIEAARARLSKAIARACETVRVTLKVYDDAYADLTRNGQPQAFRDFLLKAPSLFYELGERLGAVHHVVSFWRFRFPLNSKPLIATEELVDLLADFEASLNFENPAQGE